ncbi:MAG: DUF4276 family protein [Pyrinomonadaceae bacterium]|nr:DUF4276 family protein [Pyrinomonadaceae bacterium]
MHIEFLLEEASAEIVLGEIVPKILGGNVTFRFINLRGKQRLLKHLPNRLKGYRNILEIHKDWRIVVLVDEDRENCEILKEKLEQFAYDANLSTPARTETFQVLNRIAVEELEAWFFGDIDALRNNHPRVSENLTQRKSYRNPDAIKGGTWEALERVLTNAGYYKKGFTSKIEVARKIAPYMNPDKNCSQSFQVFKNGLMLLAEQE